MSIPESQPFNYDVFISHSTEDKPIVHQLATRLKNSGLRVWLDDWEIEPGEMIGRKLEEGLAQSRTLLLAMSKNAFSSDWVSLEHHTVLFRDPTNKERRFIPIRLDDEPITDVLKQFAYVDWRRQSNEEFSRLVSACQPKETPAPVIADQKAARPKGSILKSKVSSEINCVAMTADGQHAISGSESGVIRIWDLVSNKSVGGLTGHTSGVLGVALTADGSRVISGSRDSTVKVWDLKKRRCLATFTAHVNFVSSTAVTPDGDRAVSASADGSIRVWDLNTGGRVCSLEGHTGVIRGVAITPDGNRIVSCASDNSVRVWDVAAKRCIATLEGHRHWVWNVAVTDDGRRVVSSSGDGTLRVWDLDVNRCVATLEGHTGAVLGVAMTSDGRRAISGSADNTVRLWDVDAGICIATLKGHQGMVRSLTISPDGLRAVSGSGDGTIGVWNIPSNTQTIEERVASKYTNAKVLLVGESGVGKSGLAIRLTADHFEPTLSTDAAWATQMPLPLENTDDIEREIWLWDFAGQADYRLVHQLYMDEAAVAVLVFNPQKEEPFEGLGQWERDLERAARRPFRKLLVAGRCDRGGLMVSKSGVDHFLTQRKFDGYVETSALTGAGCAELRAAIIKHIPWEEIPWTSSPRIFKLLKNEIVRLKDEGTKDDGKVLLRMAELKQQLEMRLPGESFTPDELRAVVGLLAGPGIVWQLEFGDFILLQPERINAYAAAVIRSVRAHTEEIGCISEERVLGGDLEYQDMKRLPPGEEEIVLRAMHQTFVDHGLCLREPTEEGMLLIFPSYFKRERPELGEDHPAAFVTYDFSGQLDEIYATLIVRLNHTSAFEKSQLWRFAADFRTQANKRVGLKMVKKKDQESGSITVYFEAEIPDDTKVTFIRYVHDHLTMKAQKVMRFRHYVCSHCNTPIDSHTAVQRRLAGGHKDIVCSECEGRVQLLDLIENKFSDEKLQRQARQMAEEAQSNIDSESRELILVGHAFSIAGEAGQIFRQVSPTGLGIDGEIEFKNRKGEPSGKRVYLQLRFDHSYFHVREADGKELFTLKEPQKAKQWLEQGHPVMLVVRTEEGAFRWMNISDHLKQHGPTTEQIVFEGEPFSALNVVQLRNRYFGEPGALN